MIRKLTRKEIRNDIKTYEDTLIRRIMENTGSTKEIKKALSCNKKKLDSQAKKRRWCYTHGKRRGTGRSNPAF